MAAAIGRAVLRRRGGRMTMVRNPLTVEDGLGKMIVALGMPGAIKATGRKASYLRALSNPNRREQLTVVDMVKLERAHARAGRPGAPIFEIVASILHLAKPERLSEAYAISRCAIEIAREDCESQVALMEAGLPGADDRALKKALKETVESIQAKNRAVAVIQSLIAHEQQPP
jgi:hypothetical protein